MQNLIITQKHGSSMFIFGQKLTATIYVYSKISIGPNNVVLIDNKATRKLKDQNLGVHELWKTGIESVRKMLIKKKKDDAARKKQDKNELFIRNNYTIRQVSKDPKNKMLWSLNIIPTLKNAAFLLDSTMAADNFTHR